MGVEVAGMFGQPGGVQAERDLVDLTLVEFLASFPIPAPRCSLIVWVQRAGRAGEMFTGVVPVYDLYTVWEEVSDQSPDPLCAISRHARVCCGRHAVLPG